MNYLQIILNAAKAHLEELEYGTDSEKYRMLEEAIQHYENQKTEEDLKIKAAYSKGYRHTFCRMGYSKSDNPYQIGSNESDAWLDGYSTGEYET
jgi:hypothetical protein